MVETVFAHLKQAMGVRQFLLRGRRKVETEWLWYCLGFNVDRVVRELQRQRLRVAEALAQPAAQAA